MGQRSGSGGDGRRPDGLRAGPVLPGGPLPLGYSHPLLADPAGQPLLALRGGLSVGYTLARRVNDRGEVPECDFTDWDAGPEVGLTVYPLRRRLPDLGLYGDFYRGSRVYDDYLHGGSQAGRNYYLRVGLSHRLGRAGRP